MTDRQREALAPVWTLMAVVWVAVAMNWAVENQWGHLALSAAAGLACWAIGERTRRSACRRS